MSTPFPGQGGQQGSSSGANPQQYPGFPPPQFPRQPYGQPASPAFPGQSYPPAQQHPQMPQGGPGPYPQPPSAGGQGPQGPPSGGLADPAQSGISQQVFARATQATSFWNLLRVEFRKLAGTLSDRILLIVGPLVLIGLNLLFILSASNLFSVKDQISPLVYGVRIMHIVIHAALIKLIAGEWQHRSAQPTLLAQPSRIRYFMAQATVVFTMWIGCALLQIALTLSLMPAAAVSSGGGYLLSYRIGWVIGVALLGSLLTIMVALIVAMLLPNAAGALAVYFVAVPAMLILGGIAPKVFIWLDPTAAAQSLANIAGVPGPAPAIVSLLLWLGLLGFAGFRVLKRDVA